MLLSFQRRDSTKNFIVNMCQITDLAQSHILVPTDPSDPDGAHKKVFLMKMVVLYLQNGANMGYCFEFPNKEKLEMAEELITSALASGDNFAVIPLQGLEVADEDRRTKH